MKPLRVSARENFKFPRTFSVKRSGTILIKFPLRSLSIFSNKLATCLRFTNCTQGKDGWKTIYKLQFQLKFRCRVYSVAQIERAVPFLQTTRAKQNSTNVLFAKKMNFSNNSK